MLPLLALQGRGKIAALPLPCVHGSRVSEVKRSCLFHRVGGAQQRNVPREASKETRGGTGPHHQRYDGANIRLIHFCLGRESASLQSCRVFDININWA